MENNIEINFKKLEHINQWITNCDSKISFILTFMGVVITIIFTSSIGTDMIDTLKFRISDSINFNSLRLFIELILFMSFVFAIYKTFYYIFFTIKGRIDPTVYSEIGICASSNIFFGSISTKQFKHFCDSQNTETEDDVINDIRSQIFINSKIASEKYKNYNISLKWMLISFFIFLMYTLIK